MKNRVYDHGLVCIDGGEKIEGPISRLNLKPQKLSVRQVRILIATKTLLLCSILYFFFG